MNVETIGDVVVVTHKDQVWMLGCPQEAGTRIKEASVAPTAVLLTKQAAPGLSTFEEVPIVVRRDPLIIGSLQATPIEHAHGWDYAIKADDGAEILYTERGDVSRDDVAGYDLAIIGNKHRADTFPDTVVTRPWPEDAEWVLTAEKIWSSMDDVPDNLKKIDGTPLAIGQANFVARVAASSGEGDKENWAVGISQFKESHHKADGKWVRNKGTKKSPMNKGAQKELADDIRSRLSSAFRDQFPTGDADKVEATTTASVWWYLNDYDSARQVAIVEGSGTYYEVPFEDSGDAVVFAPRDKWAKVERQTSWVPAEELPIATALEVAGLLLAPETMQFKEQPDGRLRWYSLTTTDTTDKQNERVTPEAVDWSITLSALLGDMGPLLFRHLPLRVGGCDKQVRAGPLLFESGLVDPLDENPVAQATIDRVRTEPGRWQVSPGLRYKEGDLLDDGTYIRCWIAERSVTDRPANPTTAFAVTDLGRAKEVKLNDKALQDAAEQLGLPLDQIKALAQEYLDADKEFDTLEMALKELAEKAAADYKRPKQDDDGDDDGDEYEGMSDEEIAAAKKKKAAAKAKAAAAAAANKEDTAAAAVLAQLQQNTVALNAVAVALKEMSTSVGDEGSRDRIQEALEAYLEKVPRADAAQFASTDKGNAGDGDEKSIREMLEQVTKQLETIGPTTYGDFEAQFTSQDLNTQGGVS